MRLSGTVLETLCMSKRVGFLFIHQFFLRVGKQESVLSWSSVCSDATGSGAVSGKQTGERPCPHSQLAAPVCSRDILPWDAVTLFKSQGRGSGSPRTSCLYISPFTALTI